MQRPHTFIQALLGDRPKVEFQHVAAGDAAVRERDVCRILLDVGMPAHMLQGEDGGVQQVQLCLRQPVPLPQAVSAFLC